MQYNSTLISLYRPYLSKRLTQDRRQLVLPANQAILDRVAQSCVWAAHDIAECLRHHQRQHSLQKTNIQIVHIIFTASLIFIYDVCTRPYHESRMSLNDLQLCCRALGEIGHCYGNAVRALEVIILVKSEWQKLATAARHRPSVSLKRPSIQISANSVQEEQDGDHDGHNRPRQRARSSVLATESQTPPMFFMPPSYHSYDNLFNNQAGFDVPLNHPSISNTQGFQDLWLLPQEGNFDVEEIHNIIDWFNAGELPNDPVQPPDLVQSEGVPDTGVQTQEGESG